MEEEVDDPGRYHAAYGGLHAPSIHPALVVSSLTANVVPLSKTMKEQVELIRNWAFDRAVRASPRETAR